MYIYIYKEGLRYQHSQGKCSMLQTELNYFPGVGPGRCKHKKDMTRIFDKILKVLSEKLNYLKTARLTILFQGLFYVHSS